MAAILDLFYLYRLPKWNWNYANYRDDQNRINRRPYWIMLTIEIAKIESTCGHIEIMLIIEITKIKLAGGHIEFMLIIEMAKKKINPRPYWHYANYRDSQNRINRRPYWIYFIYIDYQCEIGIMLIIEMAKIELTSGHIGFILFI